jgi:hypothetical protein
MSKSTDLAVISATDLQGAGISAALTQNDLVEVVAHDIYNRYLEEINESIANQKQLKKEYDDLMAGEFSKMKSALKVHIKGSEVKMKEEEEDDDVYYEDESGKSEFSASFKKFEEYWPGISMSQIGINEKERGTFVDLGSYTFYLPNLKARTAKVLLTLDSGWKEETQKLKVGTIDGLITNKVMKKFEQVVTVPISRFKDFQKKVAAHNEDVKTLMSFLPKNGALSVERFTREARVKLNKNILRQQTPDFKSKISKLFQIEL